MTDEGARLYDIQSSLNTLAAALERWQGRDDPRPQPEVRQAASTAVAAIDAMLRDLHAVRERLLSEIRVSDDATAERATALLARIREENRNV